MGKHYLVNLPHCGTKIPEKYLGDYLLKNDELQNNIHQYADLFTDKIYDSFYKEFGGVKNKFSRLFFDPERFFDDEFESMSKNGLGWFYERAILTDNILRKTTNKDEISTYYKEYHNELNSKTQDKLDKYGKCTVIDCHSFSNERYWFHDKELELPDICIGFEEYHKDDFLIQVLLDEFKEYNVSINTPYSGSLVPLDYYKKNKDVKSVMIEINKKLYLESNNVDKSENFTAIEIKIQNITKKLLT